MVRRGLTALAVCLAITGVAGCKRGGQEESAPKAAFQAFTVASVYEEQLGYWSRKLEQDPRSYLSRKRIADTKVRLGDYTGQHRLYREALDVLSEASPFGPRGSLDIEYIEIAARARMALHDFQEALQLAEQCLKKGHTDPSLYFLRGEAELALGLYEKAQADFEAVAKKDPGFEVALKIAGMHEIFGRPDEALKILERAKESYHGFEMEPSALVRFRIGTNHFNAGRLDRAMEAFTDALTASRDYLPAKEKVAELLFIDNKLDAARGEYESALKIRKQPGLLLGLAKVVKAQGHDRLARSLRQEAVQIYEDSLQEGSVVYLRDLASLLLDDPKHAQRGLELAKADLTIRPGEIESNLATARALRVNGQLDEAKQHLDRALRYGTKLAPLHIEAHRLYLALKEPERAQEHFEQAVWISPSAVKSAGLSLGY